MAVALPTLLSVTALGLEIGSWSLIKVDLQRRADLAAYAAAMVYGGGSTAQDAATTGTNIAALNGAAAGRCGWSAGTNTRTCSDVSVALVTYGAAAAPAMQAVVSKSVPLQIARLISSQPTVAVSATAIAAVVAVVIPGSGGQPCITALNSKGTGITVQGGAAVNASGCTLKSNAAFADTNGSNVTASWVYASGAVTVSGNSYITNGTSTVTPTNVGSWTNNAPLYKSAPAISDPYAGNAQITSDFSALKPGTGNAFNGTWQPSTLSPGTYKSITSGSGNITINPGLYIVNGDVSIGNGAALTGTGVTIIASGSVTFGGGSAVTLSAPVTGSTSGGIPGIVMAGNSTGTETLSNGMKPTLTGVVYFPNATVAVAGGVNVANGCLELLAGSVTISNGASFGGSCTNYGAATFSSLPSSSSAAIALVQ